VEQSQTEFQSVDIREGALGIGWSGPVQIDAVVEVADESLRWSEMVRDLSSAPGDVRLSRDTWERTAEKSLRLGGSLRIIVPVGERLRLRLVGAARDTGNDFRIVETSQFILNGRPVGYDRIQADFTAPGSELAAGVRLEGVRPGHDSTWSVHAWYERVRAGWRYDVASRHHLRRTQLRADRAELGFGFRHPGPGGLLLLGGTALDAVWIRDREHFDSRDHLNQFVTTNAMNVREDILSYRVSWGAGRAFEHFELIGSARLALHPLDLLAALDIRIPL
jgi:hypothetical protein